MKEHIEQLKQINTIPKQEVTEINTKIKTAHEMPEYTTKAYRTIKNVKATVNEDTRMHTQFERQLRTSKQHRARTLKCRDRNITKHEIKCTVMKDNT